MFAKIVHLREAEILLNATSGRLPNNVYRLREHLTEIEIDKLLAALKRNRHGHRLADRACDLPARSPRIPKQP